MHEMALLGLFAVLPADGVEEIVCISQAVF